MPQAAFLLILSVSCRRDETHASRASPRVSCRASAWADAPGALRHRAPLAGLLPDRARPALPVGPVGAGQDAARALHRRGRLPARARGADAPGFDALPRVP